MDIKRILDDQKDENVWNCEPSCIQVVFNPSTHIVVNIENCFRHKLCERLSINGDGFEDLTCNPCASITKEDDFHGRIRKEAGMLVSKGERTTQDGLRLGYVTNSELREHVLAVSIDRRQLRFQLAMQTQKVCALNTRKRKLEELLGVVVDRKDLRMFLKSIVFGHQIGAFGGKKGLWDFIKDVARNLSKKPKQNRYSNKTRAIAQAMFQFGGRQVVHCFEKNLGRPGLKTLKRDRAKLVLFHCGLQKATFKEIARVLSIAKQYLGIEGNVPVMFVEDETRIEERPRWEAKYDTLIGFCGSSEEHVCSYGLEVLVGDDNESYEKIDMYEQRDVHHERSLGTKCYLKICVDYIDIFFSMKHDLRTRIVLASKVS